MDYNPNHYHVLIVDDDKDSLLSSSVLFEKWGYTVSKSQSGNEALQALKKTHYELIILDHLMPNKTGLETLKEIRATEQKSIVLMYSTDLSRETLKASYALGADDFIEKNMDFEEMRVLIEKHLTKYEMRRLLLPSSVTETSSVQQLIASVGMLGRSQQLLQIAERIRMYSPLQETVLIIGETGVGKELAAKALHGKRDTNFIAINCAQFGGDSHLLESELFGYEKGAFTGAIQRKIGAFAAANGGTVFLDEAHRLSLEAQAKLLRVLQERKIRRLGAHVEESVTFRLIVGSSPEIANMKEDGRFLLDLFHRVDVLNIKIPPLRERPADIEPIVLGIIERKNVESWAKKIIMARAIRLLESYPWPGNVRELQNVLTRAFLLGATSTITETDIENALPEIKSNKVTASQTLDSLIEQQEDERRTFLTNIIGATGSLTKAASRLGVSRSTLYGMLDQLRIPR